MFPMMSKHRVLLDSCVLVNHAVTDLLLRLSTFPSIVIPHCHPGVAGKSVRYINQTLLLMNNHFKVSNFDHHVFEHEHFNRVDIFRK